MDIRATDRELITWIDSMISSCLRPSERQACTVSYAQSTVEALTAGTSYTGHTGLTSYTQNPPANLNAQKKVCGLRVNLQVHLTTLTGGEEQAQGQGTGEESRVVYYPVKI